MSDSKRTPVQVAGDYAVLIMMVVWVGWVAYSIYRDRNGKPSEMIISHSIAPPPDVVP